MAQGTVFFKTPQQGWDLGTANELSSWQTVRRRLPPGADLAPAGPRKCTAPSMLYLRRLIPFTPVLGLLVRGFQGSATVLVIVNMMNLRNMFTGLRSDPAEAHLPVTPPSSPHPLCDFPDRWN